ncbi:hypothetical protein BKA69DRAFT_71935 [Paraphysoderma sedebokerense]|nr:hypothetical protein BKA69DRAFT_71935 [Paraphysoderma sedebokerense]
MLCLKSEVDSKEVVLTSEKQNFLRLAYDNLVLKARLESAERELRASKTPRRISTQIPGAGDMRGSISRSGDLVGSSSKNPGPAAIQEPTSKTFEPATTEVNSSFDCPICTNHYTTRENIFIVSGGCEHECCRDCARLGVKAAIGEGEMPLLCFMCKANRKAGNRCEIQECDIQLLLDHQELLVYYEKSKDKVLSENSAETVRCIDPKCGFAFFQPPGECTVTCQVCASTWCRYCDARGGHEFGITCEEYQQWRHDNDNNEDLSKKLMENLGVIQCVCKTNLEKKDNCNHIECRSCKRHYCWSCKRLFPDSQSTYAHFGQPGSCVL